MPQFGVTIPAATLERFWAMLAHRHAQLWNASELASAFGVADTTVRRYLDLLIGTFLIRALPPWHENLGKRQVKSPKIYFRDSGLLHALLGVRTLHDLERHPVLGHSWEGFALEAVAHRLDLRAGEAYFWATHSGAELDLLTVRGRRRRGFEFKRTDSPRATPSMHIAMSGLGLSRVDVVHGGRRRFPLAKGIEAVPLADLVS